MFRKSIEEFDPSRHLPDSCCISNKTGGHAGDVQGEEEEMQCQVLVVWGGYCSGSK